jgi:O-antigen/teichoic acid export membrane protein
LVAVLAGEFVNKGAVVVAFVWLARTLDPAVYGDVEWALSLLMVFTMAGDAGLATWASARVAAAPAEAAVLVARVGLLRLALAVPAYAVLSLIAWSFGGPAGSALAIYGLVLFLSPLFLQYLFNGLFQPRWAALGNALRGVTFAIAVVLLVDQGASPSVVAVAEVLGAASLALCSFVVLRVIFSDMSVRLREGWRSLLALLAQSWRTGASEVTWGVLWYAGLILLGFLATSTDAAWHSSSLRLVMALHTLVWLYLYVLLPTLARLVDNDSAGWARVVEQSLRVTGWMGWTIALVGTIGARPILTTVFGPEYEAAVPVLQAMVWVIPIAWMSGHLRYSLIAAGRPEKDYHAALIGAGTTVGLTLLLAPSMQSLGASLALLGGLVANAIAAWALARGVLPRHAFVRNAAPSLVVAAACLAGGLALRAAVGDVVAALAAGVVLAACGAFSEREVIGDLLRASMAIVKPKVGSSANAGT